jgi:hypothetical protein
LNIKAETTASARQDASSRRKKQTNPVKSKRKHTSVVKATAQKQTARKNARHVDPKLPTASVSPVAMQADGLAWWAPRCRRSNIRGLKNEIA